MYISWWKLKDRNIILMKIVNWFFIDLLFIKCIMKIIWENLISRVMEKEIDLEYSFKF